MEVSCNCLASVTLLAMLSFGAHFTRNSLSIYALYMIDDNLITPMGMGIMLSTCSAPAICLPLIAGHFVDKHSTRNLIMWISLVLVMIGQVSFLVAVTLRCYIWILVALFIFGSGASTVTATQRSMVAIYFPEKESFSMGLCISIASAAKLFGKLYVVPTVNLFHQSYQAALIMNVIACMISLLFYAFLLSSHYNFCHVGPNQITFDVREEEEDQEKQMMVELERNDDVDDSSYSLTNKQENDVKKIPLPSMFFILAIIHTLFLVVFHVLLNFIPHYAVVKWGYRKDSASMLGSYPSLITVFVSPIIGLLADYIHSIMTICFLVSVFATLMFSLILSGYASPVLTILLFACAHAVLTTLTLSKISKSVIIDRVGIAFGIVEVMDAIGNFVGHSLYGYLYELSGNYDLSMSLLYYSCIIATLTTFILSVAEMQTLFIRSRYCNIAL